VLHIGRNNPGNTYTMGGQKLAVSTSERDVGVTICNNLKPSEQCRKAAATANTVLSQIHRSFHYRDRHTYIKLYVQYVRPHLEFAAPAWSPWTAGDRACLEKVQERAIRSVSGLQSRDYSGRLAELKLPSLISRREEADMVLTYKLLSDSDTNYSAQWFDMAATRRPTRHSTGTMNLIPKRAQHDFRREFFSHRIVEKWNRLPDAVKAAKTAASFKTLYRRHTEM
jgi:ribonucleases P/MRP protein subunit RPP40